MYGNWLRVTPAEVQRAMNNPRWGAVVDQSQERRLGSDKTWHALSYLLDRKGFPVNLVFGEHSLADGHTPGAGLTGFDSESAGDGFDEPDLAMELEESALEWGYGPPGILTPQEVRIAAEALVQLQPDDLIRGVDAADLDSAEIYPHVWDSPEELEWAVHLVPDIKEYFGVAATSGDAVLCWID
jgi:Domain of unknown function (DUF1877)